MLNKLVPILLAGFVLVGCGEENTKPGKVTEDMLIGRWQCENIDVQFAAAENGIYQEYQKDVESIGEINEMSIIRTRTGLVQQIEGEEVPFEFQEKTWDEEELGDYKQKGLIAFVYVSDDEFNLTKDYELYHKGADGTFEGTHKAQLVIQCTRLNN